MYCLSIWSPCPKSYLKPLIKLKKKQLEFTAEKFIKLNIMPLPKLMDFSKLHIMYDIDYIDDRLPLSFLVT